MYTHLVRITFAICFFFLNSYAFAYDPPVGIPLPTWGSFNPVDSAPPSWPSSWPSSAVPNYYYVDNNHPNATDSNNTYGYPDKPRASFPETTYSAGAYVEIHGGPYTGGGQIIFTANGSEANPIWITGVSDSEMPLIQGEVIPKGSYLILDHLKFDTKSKTVSLRPHNSSNLHHVAIKNSTFTGPGTTGHGSVIGIWGETNNDFHDFVIYNNKISGFGDNSSGAAENDYHGVVVRDHVSNVWVLDNEIYDLGGDSVQTGIVSGVESLYPTNIYIGNNHFYDNLENAVDIKGTKDVVISGNLMHTYSATSSSSGEVVVIHNEALYVWAINNRIHDGVYGLITTGSKQTWFIGNIIYDVSAAVHMRGSTTGGVASNTISSYRNGIHILSAVSSCEIVNNILAYRQDSTGYDVWVEGSSVISGTTLDYNLFYNPSGSERIDWNTGNLVSLSSFISTFSECNNCKEGDPLFRDASSNDYQLLSSSLAASNGTESTGYSLFATRYGRSIKEDIYDNPRPMDNAWDIGSAELSGSYKAPPAPPVLRTGS